MRQYLLALALVLATTDLAFAKVYYMSPEGAGKRDGTSLDDAFPAERLSSVVNETLRPGDELHLIGGEYPGASLTVSVGGKADQPKAIRGIDQGDGLPRFVGQWSVDQPSKGPTAIRIEPGASHLTITGLRLSHYMTAVSAKADEKQPRESIHLDDIDFEFGRYGFYLSDCKDLEIQNCELTRYTKHGFRFDQGCHNVRMENCTADCSTGDAEWETKTELFPFGFSVNDGGRAQSGFRFVNCLATNNMMPLQKNRYKNGDGFVVESSATDVSFLRCRAIRNQDGGYDLKTKDVELRSCVALHNSRNFRIWSTGTLTNCFSGWAGTGLWCNGGPLTVTRSTFHELKSQAVLTDDRATETVTLVDCLISNTPKAYRNTARGKVELQSTVVIESIMAENDPRYIAPDAQWNGLGNSLNSQAYEKGYQIPAPAVFHEF